MALTEKGKVKPEPQFRSLHIRRRGSPHWNPTTQLRLLLSLPQFGPVGIPYAHCIVRILRVSFELFLVGDSKLRTCVASIDALNGVLPICSKRRNDVERD